MDIHESIDVVAKEVHCEADDETEFVQFLAHDSNERLEYFVVERALEFDEQDADLGMDTYFCELNGQGQSGYGLINLFELHRDHAIVSLNEKGTSEFHTPRIRIEFSLPDDRFLVIRDALNRIFAGFDCFQIK